MKKAFIISISAVILLIISVTVYWNLPIEITRKSAIKSGDVLVNKIETYQNTNHELPANDDWEILEKMGFSRNESLQPKYISDDKGHYEIVYFDDFGGPFLLWNSQEKKWTVDFPSILNN